MHFKIEAYKTGVSQAKAQIRVGEALGKRGTRHRISMGDRPGGASGQVTES